MSLRRVRFQARNRLVAGHRVGIFVLAVVDRAHHQRAVGVALQKDDDHLHADARDELAAPGRPGPDLPDADPAGFGVVAVPVELDHDPALLVDLDLLGAALLLGHHQCRLRPVDHRARRQGRRAEGAVAGQELVPPGVGPPAAAVAGPVALQFEFVKGADQQIFAVLARGVVPRQRGQAAGKQADGVAVAEAAAVVRLLGLVAHLGIGLALRLVLVFAGIVVELQRSMAVFARFVRIARHVGVRRHVVVVAQLHLAGAEVPPGAPVLDIFLAHLVAGLVGDEIDRRQPRHRLVRRFRIGEDHRVIALRMFEIIVDAVLLHQAADEGEIGFAVLHAIFQLGIVLAGAQLIFAAGEIMRVEHLLDDLQRGLFMEDAAVGDARQQPQPRPQHDAVGVQILRHPRRLRFDHDAVEMPLLAVMRLHRDDAARAQRGVEIDVRRLAQGFDADFEQFAQAFLGLETRKDELVLSHRGGKGADPRILFQ